MKICSNNKRFRRAKKNFSILKQRHFRFNSLKFCISSMKCNLHREKGKKEGNERIRHDFLFSPCSFISIFLFFKFTFAKYFVPLFHLMFLRFVFIISHFFSTLLFFLKMKVCAEFNFFFIFSHSLFPVFPFLFIFSLPFVFWITFSLPHNFTFNFKHL